MTSDHRLNGEPPERREAGQGDPVRLHDVVLAVMLVLFVGTFFGGWFDDTPPAIATRWSAAR